MRSTACKTIKVPGVKSREGVLLNLRRVVRPYDLWECGKG